MTKLISGSTASKNLHHSTGRYTVLFGYVVSVWVEDLTVFLIGANAPFRVDISVLDCVPLLTFVVPVFILFFLVLAVVNA